MRISWLVRLASLVLLALPAIGCAASGLEQNKAGQAAMRQRSWTDAEREFRAAIAANPQNAQFHNNLGVALINQGRYDEATEPLKRSVELKGDDAAALANLADAYHRQGDAGRAVELYRKSLYAKPNRWGIHSYYVAAAWNHGSLDTAVRDLEELLKTKDDRNDPDAINLVFGCELALIEALIWSGKYDEAIARASATIESLDRVKTEKGGYTIPIVTPFFFYIRTVPKTSINLGGYFATFHNIRGLAHYRRGEWDQAADDHRKATERSQNRIGHYSLGRALIEKGEWTDSVYHLRRAVEVEPSSKLVRFYYAAALRRAGQPDTADREREEIDRRPGMVKEPLQLRTSHEILEAMGLAAEVWDQRDEARGRYAQVIALYPKSGLAYRRLAELEADRDPARAAELARTAAELMPANAQAARLAEKLAVAR